MTWLNGWAKRVKLTIDHNDIDDALADFPILVHLGTSVGRNADDVSCVFDELESDDNRKKIAVTTSDGETQCYVEIEKWDDASEEAWLWVKVPSVASGADTCLYLYYDKNKPDNDTYVGDPNSTPAENVWDANFKFVSHMRDDPDTSHIRDSTGNNNDGTKKGAGEPAVTASGKIADGQHGDGADDEINVGDISGLFSGAFTIEAWVYHDGVATDFLWGKGVSKTKGAECFVRTTPANRYEFRFNLGSGADIVTANGIALAEQWQRVVVARDGDNLTKINVDGAEEASETITKDGETAGGFLICDSSCNPNKIPWDGIIDEVRISDIARTAAWLKASYESERDHLLDFGSEEAAATTAHGTFNGEITELGGENADERGFVWDTTSHGDPGNAIPSASGYANNWTEGNSYGAVSFSHQVTGLALGITFYVRACAHNSVGWNYGSEVEFITPQIVEPSSVQVLISVQAPSISGSGSASIAPSPIAMPSAVQAPAVSGSGSVPISPSPIVAISAILAPVISATGSALIAPSPVVVISSIQTPRMGRHIIVGITATTSAVQSPTVAGSGVAGISPAPVAAQALVVAPGVGITGQYVLPSPIVALSAIQAPSVAPTGAAPISPLPVGLISVVQSPLIAGSGVALVSPSPIVAPSAIQAPTVSGTGIVLISPSPVGVISSIQPPTVAVGAQFVAALPISVISSIQAPAIAGSGAAPISPSPVGAISAVQPPLVIGTGVALVGLSPVVVASNVQPPIASGSGSAPLFPSPLPVISTILAPSLSGTGVASISLLPIVIASGILPPGALHTIRIGWNVYNEMLEKLKPKAQFEV